MTNPIKFHLGKNPDDPFSLKELPKTSLKRILWTGQSRALDIIARVSRKPLDNIIETSCLEWYSRDRGVVLTDTAVTSMQVDYLCKAVDEVQSIDGPIIEVGSFRGVTTVALASRSTKTVYAIDPFIGYGGSKSDFDKFKERVSNVENISHVMMTSGSALKYLDGVKASLIFVDAIHDVSNSWFDIMGWTRMLSPGGMLAMHDVDDHAGSAFTARRFLKKYEQFTPWAYCPNMLIARRSL